MIFRIFCVVVVNTGQYSEVCWVYAAHAFAKSYEDDKLCLFGGKNN